jgi:hypothetical protein
LKRNILSIFFLTFFLIPAMLFNSAVAGPHEDFDFDDITYWVGEGENEAAFVVEWSYGEEEISLAWGYRWDGTAYGSDMVYALAQAVDRYSLESVATGDDHRLFTVIEDWGWGLTIFGLGYDVDGDGFTYVSDGDEDGYAMDADDVYNEGWYNGYWSYWVSDNGSEWDYSGWGIAARELSDGSWDGWCYSDIANFGSGTAPGTPVAASAPVPIPGAAWLLCSGLFGLIGIRRKMIS